MNKRAQRRAALERKKDYAQRVFGREADRKRANHMQSDCFCCVNVRRNGWTKAWDRLTLQERRFVAEEVTQ